MRLMISQPATDLCELSSGERHELHPERVEPRTIRIVPVAIDLKLVKDRHGALQGGVIDLRGNLRPGLRLGEET